MGPVVVMAASFATGNGYGLSDRRTVLPAGRPLTAPLSVTRDPLATWVAEARTVIETGETEAAAGAPAVNSAAAIAIGTPAAILRSPL